MLGDTTGQIVLVVNEEAGSTRTNGPDPMEHNIPLLI
jgi:hypothetical protein